MSRQTGRTIGAEIPSAAEEQGEHVDRNNCASRTELGGEGGIRTHVPAFGRQDAFEAPPL